MTRRNNDPLEECTMEKICLCCLCFWCCVPVYYGDSSGGGCGCCGDEDANRSVKKRTSKKRKRKNHDPASDLGLSYHDFQTLGSWEYEYMTVKSSYEIREVQGRLWFEEDVDGVGTIAGFLSFSSDGDWYHLLSERLNYCIRLKLRKDYMISQFRMITDPEWSSEITAKKSNWIGTWYYVVQQHTSQFEIFYGNKQLWYKEKMPNGDILLEPLNVLGDNRSSASAEFFNEEMEFMMKLSMVDCDITFQYKMGSGDWSGPNKASKSVPATAPPSLEIAVIPSNVEGFVDDPLASALSNTPTTDKYDISQSLDYLESYPMKSFSSFDSRYLPAHESEFLPTYSVPSSLGYSQAEMVGMDSARSLEGSVPSYNPNSTNANMGELSPRSVLSIESTVDSRNLWTQESDYLSISGQSSFAHSAPVMAAVDSDGHYIGGPISFDNNRSYAIMERSQDGGAGAASGPPSEPPPAPPSDSEGSIEIHVDTSQTSNGVTLLSLLSKSKRVPPEKQWVE